MDNKLTRIDRKKLKTRKRIIEAAISLINSRGFEETTMEEIAEKADIAKGTLYNYYSEKEAIISDYIKKSFENKEEKRASELKLYQNTKERMGYLINNLILGIDSNKEIFKKYLIHQMKNMVNLEGNKEDKSGIGGPIEIIIKLGQKEGDIREDIPVNVLRELFLFIFIQIIKQYYEKNEEFELNNKIIEKNIDLFINGVNTRR